MANKLIEYVKTQKHTVTEETLFLMCDTCETIIRTTGRIRENMIIDLDKYVYCIGCMKKDCEKCSCKRSERDYCIACREVSYANLKKENAILKEKLAELEAHVKYMPNGEGYDEAKNNFENTIK